MITFEKLTKEMREARAYHLKIANGYLGKYKYHLEQAQKFGRALESLDGQSQESLIESPGPDPVEHVIPIEARSSRPKREKVITAKNEGGRQRRCVSCGNVFSDGVADKYCSKKCQRRVWNAKYKNSLQEKAKRQEQVSKPERQGNFDEPKQQASIIYEPDIDTPF